MWGLAGWLMTSVAWGGTCDTLAQEKARIESEVTRLEVNYPMFSSSLEGCAVGAAGDQAAFGICALGVCLLASEACGEVATQMFNLGSQLERVEKLQRENGCGSGIVSRLAESVGNSIAVRNRCNRPIRVAVRYQRSDGKWMAKGWWTFSPGEFANLESSGQRLRTFHDQVYYFAETTDGRSRVVWSGDHVETVGGRVVPMRSYRDSTGTRELSLTCE